MQSLDILFTLNGYRELWIRLAQMEAEKLKAVELAVEEERRRVAEKKEEERRVVEREREEVGRLREEARVEREAGRAALQVVGLIILTFTTWHYYRVPTRVKHVKLNLSTGFRLVNLGHYF